MVHHPQTISQTKQLNGTILTRFRHYLADLRKDWSAFVQPLPYTYSMKVRCLTEQAPFSLLFTRHTPGFALLENGTDLPTDSYSKTFLQVLGSRLKALICTSLRRRHGEHHTTVQTRIQSPCCFCKHHSAAWRQAANRQATFRRNVIHGCRPNCTERVQQIDAT